MLNYIITVAISAFFVPHYIGLFWEPLRAAPGDNIIGAGVIAVLAAINVIGVNILLAIIDFMTQLLLVVMRPSRLRLSGQSTPDCTHRRGAGSLRRAIGGSAAP